MKSELENLEYEEYEKSGSDDDFTAWKLKKYVDERMADELDDFDAWKKYVDKRISQLIVALIVIFIVAILIL